MIRKTPVAFLVTSALLATGVYFYEKNHYDEKIENLDGVQKTNEATIRNQQAQLDQLREELKGTSPQLAAIQANRDRIRKKLQEYYVKGSELFNRHITSDDEVNKLSSDVQSWATDIDNWADKNMGEAAASKIFDVGTGFGVRWSAAYNDNHSNLMSYIAMVRRNLSTLIETAAWDGTVESSQTPIK